MPFLSRVHAKPKTWETTVEANSFNRMFCTYFDEPRYQELIDAFGVSHSEPAFSLVFAFHSLADLAEAGDVPAAEQIAYAGAIKTADRMRDRTLALLIVTCTTMRLAMLPDKPVPKIVDGAAQLIAKAGSVGGLAGGVLRRAMEEHWAHPNPAAFTAFRDLAQQAIQDSRYDPFDRLAIAALLYRMATEEGDRQRAVAVERAVTPLLRHREYRAFFEQAKFVSDAFAALDPEGPDLDWALQTRERWSRTRKVGFSKRMPVYWWEDLYQILKVVDGVFTQAIIDDKRNISRLNYPLNDNFLQKDTNSVFSVVQKVQKIEPPSALYSRRILEKKSNRDSRLNAYTMGLWLYMTRHPGSNENRRKVASVPVTTALIKGLGESRGGTAAFDWRRRLVTATAVDRELLRLHEMLPYFPEMHDRYAELALRLIQLHTDNGSALSAARALFKRRFGGQPRSREALQLFDLQLDFANALRRVLVAAPAAPANYQTVNEFHLLVGGARAFTTWGVPQRLREFGDLGPELRALLDAPLVRVSDIQRVLGPDEAAVVAFPTSARTVVIALTRDRVGYHISDLSRDEATREMARIRTSIRALSRNQTDFPRESARRLYDATLGATGELITGARHVFWIGFGPYGALPPALLHDGNSYAIERHAFSSLTAIEDLATRSTLGADIAAGSYRYLGIGGVSLDKDAIAFAPGERGSALDLTRMSGEAENFAPLTQMPVFLRDLGSAFAGEDTLLLGSDATARAVFQAATGADIIVFGTHGMLGDRSGLREPALLVAPGHNRETRRLRASLVAQMPLDETELVFLAACDTGAGAGRPTSEALSGLVRAFRTAGARNIVASHWAVLEGATVEILSEAAGQMVEGQPLAEALRRASLQSLKSSEAHERHPGFWAPYVVVGDGWRRFGG